MRARHRLWRPFRLPRKKRVPFVPHLPGSDALRQKSNRYVFNIKASYGDELAAIVRQLAAVGIDRVAVVYLNNAFGTGGLAMVERRRPPRRSSCWPRSRWRWTDRTWTKPWRARQQCSREAIIMVSAGKPSVDFVDAYLKAGHRSTFYMVISNTQLVQVLQDRCAWHRHHPGCATAIESNHRRGSHELQT